MRLIYEKKNIMKIRREKKKIKQKRQKPEVNENCADRIKCLIENS